MKKMCDELVQAVQAKMGEEYEVTVNEVMKVNDTKKTGLTISKVGEEQQGIHPIVYIDDLACEVCDGSTSIDDAVQKVIELYESADADEVVAEGDISNIFQNADDCLSRVRLRIVNKNLCKKMLADKVSRDFLDLVIYYQINVREDSNGFASVPVTVGLAKMLGVTEDDLYTAAINNMKGEEVVEDMATVLNKLIGEDDDRCIEENGFGAPPMLVITNKSGVYGASQMMNQDVMDQNAWKLLYNTIKHSRVDRIAVGYHK